MAAVFKSTLPLSLTVVGKTLFSISQTGLLFNQEDLSVFFPFVLSVELHPEPYLSEEYERETSAHTHKKWIEKFSQMQCGRLGKHLSSAAEWERDQIICVCGVVEGKLVKFWIDLFRVWPQDTEKCD